MNSHYTVESYEPFTSIGYLIKRCGIMVSACAEKAFEGRSLSFIQWCVLIRLRSSDGPMTATELSNCIAYDPGALSRVIEGLERGGLVARERSLKDRRVVAVGLTPAGLAEAEDSLRHVVGMLNELLEPFTSDEVKTMTTLLQKLRTRLLDYTCVPSEEPR